MKKGFYGIAAGLAIMAVGCSNDGSDGPDNNGPISIELTRGEMDAVKAINEFSFDLMRATEKRFSEENPNYVISPQSAAWNIAMLANGAEPGSRTLKEMTDVLRLGSDASIADVNDYSGKLISAITASKRSDIAIANAVHYKGGLGVRQEFLDQLRTFYRIGAFVDASNDEIDRWIGSQTHDMIKDFAKKNKLDEDDFGVLNTMWFNGFWEEEFKAENTKARDFHNADGTVSQPMMMQKGGMYGYRFSNDMCHFLKIKFRNDAFAINFILPAEGHDLRDVARYLDESNWKEMMDGGEGYPSVSVMMPRLNLKSDFDLKEIVMDMGIRKAFTSGSELSRIAKDDIMLTKFLNSSVLELNEKGTKAATVSYGGGMAMAVGPKFFHLDEPFYFFITEESTGAILFLGRVSQL